MGLGTDPTNDSSVHKMTSLQNANRHPYEIQLAQNFQRLIEPGRAVLLAVSGAVGLVQVRPKYVAGIDIQCMQARSVAVGSGT